MTAETQKSKVSRQRKKAQPPATGLEAVAKSLQALWLLPLHAIAEGRNQSIPSFLHTATGLSKARISKGNLDAVRPSTQVKIQRHQERMLSEQLKDDPQAFEHAQQKIATSPVTRTGAHASLAGWVHLFEWEPDLPLPTSKAVGLALDELIESLLEACQNDDLIGFKQKLQKHFEHHGLAARVADAPIAESVTDEDFAKLLAIESWQEAADLTVKLVDHFYIDLISTLDAEWSSHYFSGRQTMSLFPLVMVRPQDGLIETRQVSWRKNVFFRPSRRLLEFLYALVFFIRYKRWPKRSPSPSTLAKILYKPGRVELDGPELIYNYFDGSSKLTLDLVYDHWLQLFHHFMPARKDGTRVIPPFPMIMLALQWQTLLIRDKGKTFVMLDQEKYETLWRHRRQQWEAEQTDRDRSIPQTGHTKGEPIVWPSWMLNQSSSPS